MAEYKIIDVSDDAMDIAVDAEFDAPFPSLKMQLLLRELSDAFETAQTLPIFFEGLSKIHIGEKRIEISFRFSRAANKYATLNAEERDELPIASIHFVIHVFARVDRIHKLSSVPFPPNFRIFADFDEYE
jgi:hypothetical protein